MEHNPIFEGMFKPNQEHMHISSLPFSGVVSSVVQGCGGGGWGGAPGGTVMGGDLPHRSSILPIG